MTRDEMMRDDATRAARTPASPGTGPDPHSTSNTTTATATATSTTNTTWSRSDPRDRRDARHGATAGLLIVLVLLVAAYLAAPLLDTTVFWRDHFGDAASRTGIILVAPLVILGLSARIIDPLTWESELFARSAKAVAYAALFWWILAILLDAARLAAVAVAPFLLAVPLSHLQVIRRTRPLGKSARRTITLAALITLFCALMLFLVIWTMPQVALVITAAIPLGLALLAVPPAGIRLARRRSTPNTDDRPSPHRMSSHLGSPHPLDLPPGTLTPPAGLYTLVLTTAALALILLVVAPGTPMTAPVAWGALVVALPMIARAAMNRHGVSHPRALMGPSRMRRHESRIETIADETLQRIDHGVERYLVWGIGHRRLAADMAALLQEADPRFTENRIQAQLTQLPRGPWGRRARENGLISILQEAAPAPAPASAPVAASVPASADPRAGGPA